MAVGVPKYRYTTAISGAYSAGNTVSAENSALVAGGYSTDLVSQNASSPSGPFSRPIPEFLNPPKGDPGSKAYQLIP